MNISPGTSLPYFCYCHHLNSALPFQYFYPTLSKLLAPWATYLTSLPREYRLPGFITMLNGCGQLSSLVSWLLSLIMIWDLILAGNFRNVTSIQIRNHIWYVNHHYLGHYI